MPGSRNSPRYRTEVTRFMTLLFNRAVEAHRSGRTRRLKRFIERSFPAIQETLMRFIYWGSCARKPARFKRPTNSFVRPSRSIQISRLVTSTTDFICSSQSRFSRSARMLRQGNSACFRISPRHGWVAAMPCASSDATTKPSRLYNRAIALDPNIAEAHAGCGNMLAALRRYDEAIKAYDKALVVAPGIEFVESERLHCKMRLCDWKNFNV